MHVADAGRLQTVAQLRRVKTLDAGGGESLELDPAECRHDVPPHLQAVVVVGARRQLSAMVATLQRSAALVALQSSVPSPTTFCLVYPLY
jgi:hypothetical protein